jgi:glucose/arabinose dehydrogenase
MRRACSLRQLASLLIATTVGGVAGVTAPAGANVPALEQVGSFDRPTYVTSDPNDPNRLFVVEQAGRIKLVEDDTVTTFLDIAPLVHELKALGDYGLLSMAFSPNYAQDHLFYVIYSGVDDPATAPDESGDWHLDEFHADGDVADPASRREVLTVNSTQAHYGGMLEFGPDGYLYASIGDGGPQGDPNGNAQNLGNLLGKLIRIDPRGSAPGEYTVPADNPFAATAGCADGCDEIWSYGLRNPWRFSFDRLTGDLAIGDVGWNNWEEVDFDTGPNPGRGDNFGWNCREGAHPGPGETEPVCTGRAGTFTEPAFEYSHTNFGCAVTGGYVVRDHGLPDLYGRYLYGDFCTGELRSLKLGLPMAADDRSEFVYVPRLTSFGEDADCRLYAASFNGPVYRLTDPASGATVGCQPPPISGPAPEPRPLGSNSPSNGFEVGRVKHNVKSGIAFVTVFVPGPGRVGLTGDGLASVPLSRAGATGQAAAAGPVRLKVAPANEGNRARTIRRALVETGTATVKALITFVPTGGVASTKVRTMKLIQEQGRAQKGRLQA